MGQLHMKRGGLQWTREKNPDTNLEHKSKENVVFCTTVDLFTRKEGKKIRPMQKFPHHIKQEE